MNEPLPIGEAGPAPRFDRRDFVGFMGVVLIGYGAWLVFPPAGFILPGAILTAVAIFGVRG